MSESNDCENDTENGKLLIFALEEGFTVSDERMSEISESLSQLPSLEDIDVMLMDGIRPIDKDGLKELLEDDNE